MNNGRPYFAVIFTSVRTAEDDAGYSVTADRMAELAAQMPGYLGIESARGAEGVGITVSYWESLAAIKAWREQAEHRLAQAMGKERWYQRFTLRICQVEVEREFERKEV
jgi:heme-degrading monooxygenase HmoA